MADLVRLKLFSGKRKVLVALKTPRSFADGGYWCELKVIGGPPSEDLGGSSLDSLQAIFHGLRRLEHYLRQQRLYPRDAMGYDTRALLPAIIYETELLGNRFNARLQAKLDVRIRDMSSRKYDPKQAVESNETNEDSNRKPSLRVRRQTR